MPRSRGRRDRRKRRKRTRTTRESQGRRFDRFGFPRDLALYTGEHPLGKIHHDDPERGIARLAESADRVFIESITELEQLLTNTNPFTVLADFALYALLAHDPSDSELANGPPILQHHVELVQ